MEKIIVKNHKELKMWRIYMAVLKIKEKFQQKWGNTRKFKEEKRKYNHT